MTASPSIDPLALARALIRCPSVTPEDAGALPLLAELLTTHGFVCELMPFSSEGSAEVLNLWARHGTTGPNFCFAGHTDVVPPGDAARWPVDPFAAEIRDGLLIGRGAVDMKSAVACFIAAATAFLSAGGDAKGSISLLLTGDEEGPSVNGTVKVLNRLAERGERIDACLVGEPTGVDTVGDTIKIGRRGSLVVVLTALGVAGHTAYPQLADNAAHRLVAMLHALIGEPLDHGTDHFEPSTLQISSIDIGNPATNVVPDRARAVFNVRFNDLWSAARVEAWLRERLDRVGGKYELAITVSGESFITPPERLAALAAAAAADVTGRPAIYSTGGGTSDARFIHCYCPVAELGLVGRTMHKYGEAVPVADLGTLTAIYRRVLDRYFAGV